MLHQVALERTRGNVPALIEALKKYLEVYQSDGDAWEELADVYLEVGGELGGGAGSRALSHTYNEACTHSTGCTCTAFVQEIQPVVPADRFPSLWARSKAMHVLTCIRWFCCFADVLCRAGPAHVLCCATWAPQQGMYKQAAYCLEELVMINPGHSNYLVRYADTLYTIGGASNYK